METYNVYVRLFQGTTPARFKGFYNYNCGPIFDALFMLFKPLLSKKMQDRVSKLVVWLWFDVLCGIV